MNTTSNPSFEIIWEQLSCAVCTEQLKQPKVLECLHTFCSDCLKAVRHSMNGEIPCPLCRRVTQVPHGVDSLPPNFLAVNLLETLAKHDPTHKPTKYSSSSKSNWQEPLYCSEHATEEFRLYCGDCEKPICRDCALVEHRTHNYVFLQQHAQRSRERVRQSLEQLQTQSQVLATDKAHCEFNSTQISDQKTLLQAKIVEKTADLINSLTMRQDKLLDLVADLCNKKQEENVLRLTRIEDILRSYSECIGFVERSLSSRDADYIRLDPLLYRRIEELLDIEAPSPLSEGEYAFRLDLKDDFLVKDIDAFGQVYESPILKQIEAEHQECEQCEPEIEYVETEVGAQKGFLFYFLLLVFILCHCVPVFVALSKYP
eukprot:TRINITY_DN7448_c0_g1_i1.p1 TRINITY_DN7448_c0_g1~~TRINITY_DN7448_c0_g1_i1.p1  ORF type:complete len:385 (+),score=78.34 TRINITY_DN7448_c0_g1_i1:40-1155(+)